MRRLLAAFLLVWLFGAAPARAEWLKAESPNFIVYSEESEARVRERITMLENFDRLLRRITSVEEPPVVNKLHVYIVDGLSDLRIIRTVGRDVAGMYTATPFGIAAFVDRSAAGQDSRGRSRDANEVLFHEYAHHFMMQHTANAYPAWYVEGFAEYVMTAQFREGFVDIGSYSQARAYWILEGRWLPIERLLFGDTQGLSAEETAVFYAQSWLLTHYFYSNAERIGALQRYLVASREGDRGALERATGMTPEQLHRALRTYIGGGRIHYRRLDPDRTQAPPPVTLTRMPASANDLMVYQAALRVGVSDEQRTSHLQRIRALAARHRDDPFARRVLAHAEALFGDAAAADRLLDALMAADPTDAELMYIKGLRHLNAALLGDDWEGQSRLARTWLSRAHRADANHFQTLYRYAQALRGRDNYVSENTQNVLLLAHELAPQVNEITMEAAVMLISRERYAEAEILLRPLAAHPHDAGLAQSAKELLEQARTRAQEHAAPATANPS